MKRIFLILTIICGMLTSCRAQNPFQSISDMKDVETVYVGKTLLKLAGNMNLGVPGLDENINNLESVLVIDISNPKAEKKARELVKEYVENNKLEQLMNSTDGPESTIIYGLTSEDGNTLNTMLLHSIEPNEGNIILIRGTLSMDQIGKLAGGEALDNFQEEIATEKSME